MISSYLVFSLSGRLFGVKLLGAIEILPWRGSRPVPLSYSYVEGLIDYRGTIYPVFNLLKRLGMSSPGPIGFTAEQQAQTEAGQSIILLEENKTLFGVIVDTVVKMAKLEDPGPEGASEKIHGIDAKFVRGIANDNDQEILILDFERLLHAG
jgi:purine-binding chemotaxis protein CheW